MPVVSGLRNGRGRHFLEREYRVGNPQFRRSCPRYADHGERRILKQLGTEVWLELGRMTLESRIAGVREVRVRTCESYGTEIHRQGGECECATLRLQDGPWGIPEAGV